MGTTIIIKDQARSQPFTGSVLQGQKLVTDCLDVLVREYPGFIWNTQLSADFSVVGIRCFDIHGQYGIILHTTTVQNDPTMLCVKRAGGELLERAFLARGRKDSTEISRFDLRGAKSKRLADANCFVKELTDVAR